MSWGVVLWVPCHIRCVQCYAALCWCAWVVLFVCFVLFLVPGAVVHCCVLCRFIWSPVVRCHASLLGAYCAVLLRTVPCRPAA